MIPATYLPTSVAVTMLAGFDFDRLDAETDGPHAEHHDDDEHPFGFPVESEGGEHD